MDAPAAATITRAVALFALFRMLRGTIDFRAFLERRGFVCDFTSNAGLRQPWIVLARTRFQSFTGADWRGINLPCATSVKSTATNT